MEVHDKFHKTQYSFNHIFCFYHLQVQAYDPDDGKNAEITYSLLDHANFQVDSVSGWVTAATEFDREKRDSYQVCFTIIHNIPLPKLT